MKKRSELATAALSIEHVFDEGRVRSDRLQLIATIDQGIRAYETLGEALFDMDEALEAMRSALRCAMSREGIPGEELPEHIIKSAEENTRFSGCMYCRRRILDGYRTEGSEKEVAPTNRRTVK